MYVCGRQVGAGLGGGSLSAPPTDLTGNSQDSLSLSLSAVVTEVNQSEGKWRPPMNDTICKCSVSVL